MEIRFIIHQMKRKIGAVNLSKHCCPKSERKYPLFKGEFRSQYKYVTKVLSDNRHFQFTGVTSSKMYVLAHKFTPWWSERDRRRLSALIVE
jgi:hypothetical protein